MLHQQLACTCLNQTSHQHLSGLRARYWAWQLTLKKKLEVTHHASKALGEDVPTAFNRLLTLLTTF